MKKLGIILILAACLAILCIAGGALADFPASGNCGVSTDEWGNPIIGNNATFSFDSSTGTLTISGSGKMSDLGCWSIFNVSDDAEKRVVSKIVVEEGITSIGNFAFNNFVKVKVVEFPSTLKSIGENAFYGCTALKAVSIPTGVTSIGKYAFFGCNTLESLFIPDSVTTLGNGVFQYCYRLKSVTLPNGITAIPEDTFRDNYQLTSIVIPASVTTIGDYAFQGCNSLALEVPDTVTTFGDAVAPNCGIDSTPTVIASFNSETGKKVSKAGYLLREKGQKYSMMATYAGDQLVSLKVVKSDEDCTTAEIINGVTEIGDNAFGGRYKLENVTIPATVTKIGTGAFQSCTKLTKLVIPNSVMTIGERAFGDCDKLATVTLPDNLTQIPKEAFKYDGALTSLSIPATVTSIGDYAFQNTGLSTIELPESVTAIGTASEYDTKLAVIADPKSAIGKLAANAGYALRARGTNYSVRPTYSGGNVSALTVVRIDYDNSALLSFAEGVTAIAENCETSGDSNKVKAFALPLSLKSIEGYALQWWNIQNVYYAGTEADKAKITVSQDNGYTSNGNIIWHYGETAPEDVTDPWTVTYEWNFPTGSNWQNGKLKAKAVCKNHPNHVIEEEANAYYWTDNSTPKWPTCTEPGIVNRGSDGFQHYGLFESKQEKDIEVPALGHDFEITEYHQPSYAWSLDFTKGFASITCSRCEEKFLEEAPTTSTVSADKKTKTYTATFKDKRFTTQTVNVTAGYDILPPILKKVTVNTKEISKPGVVSLSFEFEEDEAGLVSWEIWSCGPNTVNGPSASMYYDSPKFTGTINADLDFDDRMASGQYYINMIHLRDERGNEVWYYADDWENGKTTELVAHDQATWAAIDKAPINNGFTIADNLPTDFQMFITAPKLVERINNMPDNGTGMITYNYNDSVVPKAVFDAMKGKKNATFVFTNNEIQWMWKGSDLTEETKDVDLRVNSWTEPGSNYGIEGNEDVLVIQFADNGKLPGPVKIRIKSDYYFKINGLQRAAYLYYANGNELYNQDSGVTAVLDRGDHWCEFTISHNSTYIVSANKATNAGADPTMTPQEKIRAFVNRCYTVILGRGADPEGLEAWANALATGVRAASEIIDGFVNSPEFRNKGLSSEQQVVILYKAMLGREPDPAGLAAWTDVLNQGYPFGTVINGFCGSIEFTNLCAEYGIQPGSVDVGDVQPVTPTANMGKIKAFVTRCYSVILGREPDPAGLDAWANALATGEAKASEIINGFVNSQEYLSKNLSHEASVKVLYQAMLGRDPDPEGKAAWVKVLDEGNPFGVVINGFCGSIEFTNLCAEYGIQPGSVQVKAALIKRVSITPEGSDAEESATYVAYTSEYINEEKIRAFVKHCYETVLGREGDEEGIANYTALIMDGKKTPKRVAYEFVFSPEFQNQLPGNEELIKILYKLYLNREPGAEELAGWIEMLDGGAGLDEVLKGFAESAEFRAIMREMKE